MQASLLSDIDRHAVLSLMSACLDGRHLKIMPSEFYRQFRQNELSAFCLMMGLYCLPTTELLEKLNSLILEASPERNAIELGAGNGAIGRGLGIRSTDSFMQDDPRIQALYAATGQPPVTYGDNVEQLDANSAVEALRPAVTVAAWLTHKYDPALHDLGGNMFGVDEGTILRQVKRYIVVGNLSVHSKKPIMGQVSQVIRGDYLFSRSINHPEENAIFVWDQPRQALDAAASQ